LAYFLPTFLLHFFAAFIALLQGIHGHRDSYGKKDHENFHDVYFHNCHCGRVFPGKSTKSEKFERDSYCA